MALDISPSPRPQPTEYVLTLSCPDRPGIVHAVSALLVQAGGNITESQQFGGAQSHLFFMRVQFTTTTSIDELKKHIVALELKFAMEWAIDVVGRRIRTIIMVSKDGHCLSDLLYRTRNSRLPIEVMAVIGNHPDLEELATFYDVPFHYISVTPENKPEAEARILELITYHRCELVVLARYMQILSADFCQKLQGHMINIHHSFLPSFKGARPYAQAYARGVKLIGATAHYVTADLDEGPIIEQDIERVTHGDDIDELMAIGQDVEQRTLARAVRWHAEHRVLLDGTRTIVFR